MLCEANSESPTKARSTKSFKHSKNKGGGAESPPRRSYSFRRPKPGDEPDSRLSRLGSTFARNHPDLDDEDVDEDGNPVDLSWAYGEEKRYRDLATATAMRVAAAADAAASGHVLELPTAKMPDANAAVWRKLGAGGPGGPKDDTVLKGGRPLADPRGARGAGQHAPPPPPPPAPAAHAPEAPSVSEPTAETDDEPVVPLSAAAPTAAPIRAMSLSADDMAPAAASATADAQSEALASEEAVTATPAAAPLPAAAAGAPANAAAWSGEGDAAAPAAAAARRSQRRDNAEDARTTKHTSLPTPSEHVEEVRHFSLPNPEAADAAAAPTRNSGNKPS